MQATAGCRLIDRPLTIWIESVRECLLDMSTTDNFLERIRLHCIELEK